MKPFKTFVASLLLLLSISAHSQQESTVIIARNNGFVGAAAPAHVFINYEYMGKLKNDNYIQYTTTDDRVDIAVISSLGICKAISIPLLKQQNNYINVNLAKTYFLKLVTHDEELKSKVMNRTVGTELLVAESSEKSKMLDKHRKKLDKAYGADKVERMEIADLGVYASMYTKNPTAGNTTNTAATTSENPTTKITTLAKVTPATSVNEKVKTVPKEKGEASAIGVEEIYKNYFKYIDPNGKVKSLKSLTRTESISSVTKTNEMEMQNAMISVNFKTKDGKVVSIMKMPTANSKTVFDGSGGYTELSSGFKMDLTPELIQTFKNVDYNFFVEQTIHQDAVVSIKEYEGKKVYSVQYSYTVSGTDMNMEDFYDTNTFEKVLSIQKSVTNGQTYLTTVAYQDYQDFDGIKFPGTQITELNQATLQLKSISQLAYTFNESYTTYANQPLEKAAASLAAVPDAKMSFSDVNLNTVAVASTPVITAETEEELRNSDIFDQLNKREQAHQLVLVKQKELGSSAPAGFSTNTAITVETHGEKERVSRIEQANAGTLKYRRSSLYTLMIDDNTREHYNVIKDAFGNTELSDKFNNHNIGPYLIPAHSKSGEDDQTQLIEDYLNANGVARNLVAKWFNRDANGFFNMNLIAERGQYNASEIDIKVAQSSIRGKAQLSDAGRELINNTFVIVYDYKYTNKAEQAKKRKGWLNAVTTVASFVPGADQVSSISTVAGVASDVVGKGYFVRTRSYLYRLVWNDEIANEFYTTLWIDENNNDEAKKAAFDTTNLFKLEFVGDEYSRNNLQSTIFSSKSSEQLIEIATTKAVDKNIGKLQRNYEEFRVKTPLLSTEPIAAKIGLKEDIDKKDKFEVLEQVLNEDGTTSYERVAIIKVDKAHIWDNTFLSEETAETTEPYTVFKGNNQKLAPGMLIRQIN